MTDKIDELLTRHYARGSGETEAGARVMTKLKTLPRQKHALWTRIPSILLDWQFAPAWPRLAALACCAALGFVVGVVGVDRVTATPRTDLASAVFEPETFTGLRP